MRMGDDTEIIRFDVLPTQCHHHYVCRNDFEITTILSKNIANENLVNDRYLILQLPLDEQTPTIRDKSVENKSVRKQNPRHCGYETSAVTFQKKDSKAIE